MNENIILTSIFSLIPLLSSLLLISAPEEVVPGRKYSRILNFSISIILILLVFLVSNKDLIFVLLALILLNHFLDKKSLLSLIIISLSSSYLIFASVNLENIPFSSSVLILLLSFYWLLLSYYSKEFSVDKEELPKITSWRLIKKSIFLSVMLFLFSYFYTLIF